MMQIGRLYVQKKKKGITWKVGNISVTAPIKLPPPLRNIILDELKIKSIVFSKDYSDLMLNNKRKKKTSSHNANSISML